MLVTIRLNFEATIEVPDNGNIFDVQRDALSRLRIDSPGMKMGEMQITVYDHSRYNPALATPTGIGGNFKAAPKGEVAEPVPDDVRAQAQANVREVNLEPEGMTADSTTVPDPNDR